MRFIIRPIRPISLSLRPIFPQKGFLKLTKKSLATTLIILISLTTLISLWLYFFPKGAEAAWFDDNWGYRQRIDATVTSSASDISNLDTLLTVDTTGITAKLQSSCQDLRFTNTNGNLLPYFIDSCTNNSATNKIWVRADLVPKNTTKYTIYMYYGNPSATAGSDSQTMYQVNGLEGYWTMNESSWTNDCSTATVVDSSVNANTGKSCPASTGPTGGATGNYGNAGSFDGSNDYVNSGTSDTLGNFTAFTLSAWVKPNDSSTDGFGDPIIDRENDALGYQLVWRDGTNTRFCLMTYAGFETCGTTGKTNDGTVWYHVVGTFDGSTARIYVNGVSENQRATSYTNNSGHATVIGAHDTGTTRFLQAGIDDVRVYSRAFSDSEVLKLYQNPGSITTTATATSNPSTSFASEEKAPSPTLYWKFDDTTVGTAQDSTANNLDGTHNNTPTIQTEDFCISAKCLYFDGANNENVSLADNAKLDFSATDNFTVSAWVKRNGASSAINYIATKHDVTDDTEDGGYKLWMDADGDLCFGIDDDITWGPDISACSTNANFDDDKWHFVSGVRSNTDDKVYVYVDGVQKDSQTDPTTLTLANSNTFYVGVDRDGTSNEWLGFIDEVKVYSYQRSASQILADFNARSNNEGASAVIASDPRSNLSNGLVGYWKMDEAATPALDSSGNGNSGTWETLTSTSGKFGNANNFNGVGDLGIGNRAALKVTGSLSLSAWVNLTNTSSIHTIIAKNDNGETEYSLYTDTNGKINMDISSDGTTVSTATGTTTLSSSRWYHLTGVFTPSTSIKVYVDGVQDGQNNTSIPTSINAGAAANFYIGMKYSATKYMVGNIDEARVYNRALSNNEVTQLYNFAPGPVLYWKLDEKSGTTAKDSSGYGNNSTSFNGTGSPTYTNGKFGGALNFDGNNSNVRMTETASVDLGATTDSYTVSAWIKTTANFSDNGIILAKEDDGSGIYPFILYLTSNEFAKFAISADTLPTVSGTTALNDGKWHYIVGVRDVFNDKLFLYVDGVQITSTDDTTTTSAKDSSDVVLGNGGVNYNSSDFNGQIDEAKVYNYARTSGQIIEDMNAGHPAPGSPVGSAVGYWKFDEGYSTTVNDSSSQNGSENLVMSAATNWTNSGKFGKAYNGADNIRASMAADDNDLDFLSGEDISISLWFKSDAAGNPSANEYLVEKGASVGTAAVGYAVYSSSSNDGLICFGIDDDAVTNFPEDSVCSSSDLYDTNWHHILAKKTASSRLDLYVDGKPNGTPDTSISATGSLGTSSVFRVGDANATDGTDEFLGDIDELKVFRSALTDQQALVEYNHGSSQVMGALSQSSGSTDPGTAASQEYCVPGDSTSCAGPVGRWDLEEGSGTNAFDSSGGGNTGTITGATYKLGKQGKALNFNGSTDTVSVSNSLSTKTVEFWVNPSTTTENLIDLRTAATAASISVSSGTIVATGFTSPTYCKNGACSTTAPTISANTWTHIGITTGTAITANAIQFGRISSTSLTGKLDSIRIFDYARSAAQVAWDYNQGKPVAHWKMDECQGTSINDSSGNSLTGTLTVGAAPAVGTCTTSSTAWGGASGTGAGKRNYALTFDGTDDYVSVADNTILKPSTFSFSFWVNKVTEPANFEFIMSKTKQTVAKEGWAGLFDNSSSNRKVYAAIYNTSGTETNTASLAQSLTTGVWRHYTFTFDGTTLTHYENGVSLGTQTLSGTFQTSTNSLYFATNNAGGNYPNILIDDARFYNYPLTPLQIRTLYNGGGINYSPSTGAP